MIYTVIDYFKTIYFNTDSGKPYMSMESQRCSGLILESQTWFKLHFRYEKVLELFTGTHVTLIFT